MDRSRPVEKRWIHDEFGYDIILWDVDPYDWKRPGPAVVRARILKETRPGSIVLSHDIHPGTIDAMPSTFDELEAKGFKFVTVSQLIQMAAARPSHPSPQPNAKRSTERRRIPFSDSLSSVFASVRLCVLDVPTSSQRQDRDPPSVARSAGAQ